MRALMCCRIMRIPTRFILNEVYRDNAAPAAHKETAHYAAWRDTVANMMAEPRHAVKLTNHFPPTVNGSPVNAAFEFATATRIIFGEGKLDEAPATIEGFGKRYSSSLAAHPHAPRLC